MKEIESISAALFDKIRSRFPNVTLGDEKAKAVTDPEKARFFNFTYAGEDGAEFGTVTASLIDETSLKIYFGQNISGEMDREQRLEWYKFLRNLRLFAKRNLLTFDTRDINKSNLNLQDIQQQSQSDDKFTTNDVSMTEAVVTESKLYGTSRNSYADMGECKLVIKHDGLVSDEKHGDRARRIRDIFIETSRGERLLVPFKNLHGARALAQHISHGGTMHDEIAEHITNIVNEMSAMRHFVRSTKNRQFEDQETADMTRSAVHHYDELKRKLRQMRGARGYRSYFEDWSTWSQAENPLEDIDVDELRERFVKKIYDDRFTEALPIVYKAYKKYKSEAAGHLGDELAEWAEEVTESTWLKPDSADKITALRELLKTPLPCGVDGIDAQYKIESLIGDDDLNDDLFALAQSQGPDADCRPLIKKWMVHVMPGLLDQMEIGQKNSQHAETNWQTPVSPQMAHPNDQYGNTGIDEPVTESDDGLDFIRSLAGIRIK
jgi:hypothetical protein